MADILAAFEQLDNQDKKKKASSSKKTPQQSYPCPISISPSVLTPSQTRRSNPPQRPPSLTNLNHHLPPTIPTRLARTLP
jgi:hypothetical protein